MNSVRGYLDGSTKNPLAAHENATFASDRRIFSSDGNLTMQKYSILLCEQGPITHYLYSILASSRRVLRLQTLAEMSWNV